MLLSLVIFNFLVYYLLNQNFNVKIKIVLSFFFVILCFAIKFNIDVSQMPDYDGYFQVIGTVNPEISIKTLFAEPYYFQIVNYLYQNNSATDSIKYFYNINFVLTLTFFIWLSFLNDISIWKKIVLYVLYFYLFSYVLLRNAPAYLLIGILYYYLHKGKYVRICLLSFFAHLSSLPILLFSFFKNKKGDKKLLVLLLLFFFGFNILLKLPVFGIYEKFTYYREGHAYGQSIFHKVYFIFMLIINMFLVFKNRDLLYNYTYSFIFLTYFFIQLASPVMGFRFSIYIILYLLLNPKLVIDDKLEKWFNWLSPVLVVFVINSYFSILT